MEVVAKDPEKNGTTNVHDDGLSPSVMKALVTETQRKSFFSLLRVSVAIFFHGKDTKTQSFFRSCSSSARQAKKSSFVPSWFKAFVLFATASIGDCLQARGDIGWAYS